MPAGYSVHPLLARSLGPLAPTLEELTSVLSEQRASRRAMGKYLDPKLLDRAIRQAAPSK